VERQAWPGQWKESSPITIHNAHFARGERSDQHRLRKICSRNAKKLGADMGLLDQGLIGFAAPVYHTLPETPSPQNLRLPGDAPSWIMNTAFRNDLYWGPLASHHPF
jgi:hypothetical protein